MRGCGAAGLRGIVRSNDARSRSRHDTALMQNPNKLAVSSRALELAVTVYRRTERFPSQERFGPTAQMREAAVSIGSNIAEGCGRWQA